MRVARTYCRDINISITKLLTCLSQCLFSYAERLSNLPPIINRFEVRSNKLTRFTMFLLIWLFVKEEGLPRIFHVSFTNYHKMYNLTYFQKKTEHDVMLANQFYSISHRFSFLSNLWVILLPPVL